MFSTPRPYISMFFEWIQLLGIYPRFFSLTLFVITSNYSCKNQAQVKKLTNDKKANHLINETSPYLLQHAYNPVDWYPWSEAALKKAKDEDKLLIISIGYAACHWCHVMEHESFEDSTVAALMNEHFVSIKVDREERPDIDDIYMSAAQLISGSGGWPLNAFALPDGRPIWAGTYFPKDRWMDILKQFATLKNDDKARLERTATSLTSGINSMDAVIKAEATAFDPKELDELASNIIRQTDQKNGGRRGAPKFPMPNNYELLLRYGTSKDDKSALESVYKTLDKMALGGIYDQIGGGFARYSVDDMWKVPHFEKMLYDNAQLVSLYSHAYRKTKNPLYKNVVIQTLNFIDREMTHPAGGFYSSLDADSEGEEGKFYVWKESELVQALNDPALIKLAKRAYSIEANGNWEHGNNILIFSEHPAKLAAEFKLSLEEFWIQMDKINTILLQERSKRIRPGLDDKILTSWNGLMIKGYVDAYRALGDVKYLEKAERQAHFILDKQWKKEGNLNRNYKNSKSTINGFLDDYASLIDAFIGLYEISFDESWLNVSKDLVEYTRSHFFDTESHMFYYTSDLDPPLVARKKELSDNVIPASNSMMARNMIRLGEIMYEEEYIALAKQMLGNMWPSVNSSGQPGFYSNWLQLFYDHIHPAYEIVVMGPKAYKVSHELMAEYYPNALFLGGLKESNLPLLLNKYVEGQTTIYVCQNKVCRLPVTDVDAARKLIKVKG